MTNLISTRRLAAAIAALMLCGFAHAHGAEAHKPAWPGGNDYQRSVRSYSIPDVTLTDANDRPVNIRKLLATDTPVMLNFIFTTCGTICPTMVKVFADVPSRLGASAKNLTMVSITIDPENDTPAKLKSYAENFNVASGWTFLTGRVQDVKTIQIAFDSYRGDKMSHEPLTLMRRSQNQPWVRIDGFASPDELVREFKKVAAK